MFEEVLNIELIRDYENVWEWIWNKNRDDLVDFNISREHNWKTGEYDKPLRIIISSKSKINDEELTKYCMQIIEVVKSDLYKGDYSLADREINNYSKKDEITFKEKEQLGRLRLRFNKYLQERKSIHLNDSHSTYKKWDELIQILSENESETIKLLKSSTKDEIDYISEVMEEVAGKLNSNNYIDALKETSEKYPECRLEYTIEISIQYMNK